MRTYTIPVYRVYRSEIKVDAENIQEAIEKMEGMIDNGDLPDEQPGELDSIEMDHDADPSTIIEEENPQYAYFASMVCRFRLKRSEHFG